MCRKNGGDKQCGVTVQAKFPRENQHENRTDDVQQHIRQVVRSGIKSKKMAIQLMRQPRNGMPVTDIAMQAGECPNRVVPGKTAVNVRILVDVGGVIQGHERKKNGGQKYQEDKRVK